MNADPYAGEDFFAYAERLDEAAHSILARLDIAVVPAAWSDTDGRRPLWLSLEEIAWLSKLAREARNDARAPMVSEVVSLRLQRSLVAWHDAKDNPSAPQPRGSRS